MSKEFFDIMDGISETANKIKFLEGSHPEVIGDVLEFARDVYENLGMIEEKIIEQLEKKAKNQITPIKKKKK